MIHGNPIEKFTGGLLIALILGTSPPWAQGGGPQGPFANVRANAQCTIQETDDLRVVALLEQKEKIGVEAYEVGDVTFSLEQKIGNNPKFQPVSGSTVVVPVVTSFEAVEPGQEVEVATNIYDNICAKLPIDPGANSVRAVVEIEVLNAKETNNDGRIRTGRCVSLASPCKR